jgi:hypothetical protein
MEDLDMTMTDISAIRSRVCTLGNQLAHTMGRRAAFIYAWQSVKGGQVEFRVAGVSFGTRQEALRRLATYRPADVRVWLAPEPENPADPAAVAVMAMVNGGRGAYRLGYIPATQTGTAQALKGKLPRIRILAGDIYGARLSVPV